MSCVLRITAEPSSLGTLVSYRIDKGTAHIQVSLAEADDVRTQMRDALAFLQRHQAALQQALGEPNTQGVLDFAVAWRDVALQVDVFPAELVRVAGQIGLALMFSHDPDH